MFGKYVEGLVDQQIIEPEKKEIYAYGLQQGVILICFVSVSLIQWFAGVERFAICIAIALMFVAWLMVLGKIKIWRMK
jgi:hypothetical protein